MRVRIIGSGTAVPVAERGQASVLLEGRSELILLDAGSGSLRGLVRAGIDPREVDFILISHLHIDHVADLPTWLFAFRNPEFRREKTLYLGDGKNLERHLSLLREAYGEQIEPPVEVRVIDLHREKLPSLEFEVKSLPVSHTRESCGFRIRERATGLMVAYSGDTEECPGLVELGRDSDIFILECSFPDESAGPGHLYPEAALRVARLCRPRKLILTHFYPGWDPRKVILQTTERLPGTEVLVAEDGMTVELG